LLFHALHDAIADGLLLAEIGHLPPAGVIGTIMRGQ